MPTKHIKMEDCENCIICQEFIGKGNDPAVCGERCLGLYKYECSFNSWAREQANMDNHQVINQDENTRQS